MKTYILALIILFLFIIIRHFCRIRENLSCLSTQDSVTEAKNVADISNSQQQLSKFSALVAQAEKNAATNKSNVQANLDKNLALLRELCPTKCPHMYASDSLAIQEDKCSNSCCHFDRDLFGNTCKDPYNSPGDEDDGKKEAAKYAVNESPGPGAMSSGTLGVSWTSKDRSTI